MTSDLGLAPSADPPTQPIPSEDFATRLQGIWPFTGRHRETAVIEGLLQVPGQSAVFLVGPAGVGKTRLATELRRRAEQRGIATLRVIGTATAAGVPFAAVAHLLPEEILDPNEGPIARHAANEAALLVKMVQRSVREQAPSGVTIFVDDAHLLDSMSATVISALIANRDAHVVATMRLGESAPDALASGLRSGESASIDIGEIADADVASLLQAALGAPIDPVALEALRARANGSMLFLRELVLGAVRSGSLSDVDGVWRLTGMLTPSSRLQEVLAARLANVSAGDQQAIALVAVAGRLSLRTLEMLASDADLIGLEESGILSVIDSAGCTPITASRHHPEVVFAHPLFGEEVLRRISKLRLRSIRIELANALEATGSDANDVLRVAVLRLDAGVSGDPRALERGARLARYAHDYFLTARLARAAFDERPSAALAVMLGEALYETGRFEESVAVLRSSLAVIADERAILAVGGQLLTGLFWGLADDEAAAVVVEELSARLNEPDCVGALFAHRASLATFSGNPRLGMQLLDLLPTLDDPVAYCQTAVTRSMTLTLVGQSAEGLAVADRALELHDGFEQPMLLPHPSIHLANGAFALLHAGSAGLALARALEGYDLATADGVVVSLVWCRLVAGDACLSLGRGADALLHFETALRDAMREQFRGQVAMAWAGIATTRCRLGDVDGARVALARSDAETSRIGSFDLNVFAARATVLAASGDYGSACAELDRGVHHAAVGGNVIGEAWMLHELTRLGMFVSAAPRLAMLADPCPNALVRGRSLHAAALVADDAEQLVAAAERFAALDAPTLAAEAALAASGSFRRRGETRRANASAHRATMLLAPTDLVPLPDSSGSSTPTPLTAREREVAYLAAEGVSNKYIAERLFLSSRTVENHLSKVFVKLGVSTRLELPEALHPSDASLRFSDG